MKEQVLDILKDGINDIETVKKQYTTMHTQDVLDALRRLHDRINELTIPVVVLQSEQLPKNNCTLNIQTCGKGSGCKYPHCHI